MIRADYWKSNDRKYCDFCKCWITDNKPSVAFHENGRRHKANVSNRISEISRNSAKLEKEKQKNDSDIRKMEDAALRSYAHDVSSRADLTARSINTVMQLNSMKTGGQVDPMLPPSDFNAENDYNKPILPDREPEIKEESMWVEAKSPDGHTYYWNVKTNESIWEKPKEGYMPIDEYHKINQIAIAQQQLELQKDSKNFQENAAEVVAKYRREELKKYRKTDSDEKIKEQKRQTYKTQEDVQGAAPIGTWQIIEEKKEEHIDLQLPKLEYCNTYPITSDVQEPPVKRFKEKTIDTLPVDLSAEGSSTFKKRKGIRRDNARQRLDVD